MSCGVHGEYLCENCRECLGQPATCRGCDNRFTDACKPPCVYAKPTAAEIAAAKKQAEAELVAKVANFTSRDYLRKRGVATDDGFLQQLSGVLRIAAALEGIEDRLGGIEDALRERKS